MTIGTESAILMIVTGSVCLLIPGTLREYLGRLHWAIWKHIDSSQSFKEDCVNTNTTYIRIMGAVLIGAVAADLLLSL